MPARRRSHALVAALLAFAGAVPLAAQSPTTSAAPATLLGLVTDTAATPLAGVTVNVLPGDQRVVTAAAGRFEIGGLAPGVHLVAVRRLGYAPLRFEVTLAAGERAAFRLQMTATSAQELAPVVVEADMVARRLPKVAERRDNGQGKHVTGAELQAVRHAYTVRDAINQSVTLRGAQVNAVDACDVYVDARMVPRNLKTTFPLEHWAELDEIEAVEVHRDRIGIGDAVLDSEFIFDGARYRCAVLIWTKYIHLRFGARDAGFVEDTAAKANRERMAALLAEQRAREAHAPGTRTGTLAGWVLDPGQRPVAGARVTLVGAPAQGRRPRTVVTDSTGAFTFADVPAGAAVVRVDPDGCPAVLADAVVVAGERVARMVTVCAGGGRE